MYIYDIYSVNVINIFLLYECSYLCVFGIGVFKVIGMLGVDFFFFLSQENGLEGDRGEGRKILELLLGDLYTLLSEVLNKKVLVF